MQEEKYYTPKEIADKFKVNKGTVYYWIKEGRLGSIRLGSLIRVPKSSLNEFIEKSNKGED